MPPERFLDDRNFRAFSDYIYELTGIAYGENKRYLLDSRIRRRALRNGCTTPEAYLELLHDKGKSRDEIETLIDEISTHETSFFRHKDQMDIFAKLVGELMQDVALGPPRQLNIWSAACSSGEEPYTVSMILHGLLDAARGWSASIWATDISAPVVATARAGRYPRRVVHTIPDLFTRHIDEDDDGTFTFKPEIKRHVRFDVLSLVDKARLQAVRNMDIIFCRNVLIYFDDKTKSQVVDALFHSLRPGGYLVLGPSDSLHGFANRFERTPYSAFNFYRRPQAPQEAPPPASGSGLRGTTPPDAAGQSLRLKILVNRLSNGLQDLAGDVDSSLARTVESFAGLSDAIDKATQVDGLPAKARAEIRTASRHIARILVYMQVADRTQQKSEAMRGLLQELSDRVLGQEKEAPDLGVRTSAYDAKLLPSQDDDEGEGDEMSQDDIDALFD